MERPHPGTAIVARWAADPRYFILCLMQMDAVSIMALDSAAVAFHRSHGSDLTIDRRLAAWQAAAQQCAIEA